MYREHTVCRACNFGAIGAQGIKSGPVSEKLIEVLDLGIQPLANDFKSEGEERAGFAPLKVLFCPRCSLSQLSVVVRPDILYSNYPYVTSPSDMMHKHLRHLISDIADEQPNPRSVLEIGSNDGLLLAMMEEYGYSVTGVDPAQNLAAIAEAQRGVKTRVGFFDSKLALDLSQYDIVIARHVFCHVDDWRDFAKGLELVSHLDTLICIEVPYAGDTIKNCEFDCCYHEHLSYLTIKAVKALLASTDLRLHRIIRYPIHGGAVLLMLRHKDRAADVEFYEDITFHEWREFAKQAHDQISKLKATVTTLRAQGKRIAGFGASAKSTVWINACGFNRKDIAFICDNTPQKQYKFSPGTDIPIVDEGALLRELPDYMVMWCWNFASEVLEKQKLYREKGGKFIIPIPEVEIV